MLYYPISTVMANALAHFTICKITDVLLFITCVVTLSTLTYDRLVSPVAQPQSLMQGKTLSVSNVDWSSSKKTITLVLKVDCPFCSASAPFYQRLWSQATKRHVHVIAVSSQSKETTASYLREVGLQFLPTRHLSTRQIGVSSTPTLFIVDQKGVVLRSWVGQLSPVEEDVVLNSL